MPLYGLTEFIADLYRITEEEKQGRAILRRCQPLLERLLRNPYCVPPEFKKPGATTQGRYMLHRTPRFNVNAVVWGPGHGLKAHNHETWGLVGILENELQETRYRRLDDGSKPGIARLELKGTTNNRAGDISLLLPPDDIHGVFNATERNTVDIHVYGRDLVGLKRSRFDTEQNSLATFASPKYDNC